MSRDEALLIKQWDARAASRPRSVRSDSRASTFSFPARQDDTTRTDAPDRWSMEVRCAVIH